MPIFTGMKYEYNAVQREFFKNLCSRLNIENSKHCKAILLRHNNIELYHIVSNKVWRQTEAPQYTFRHIHIHVQSLVLNVP